MSMIGSLGRRNSFMYDDKSIIKIINIKLITKCGILTAVPNLVNAKKYVSLQLKAAPHNLEALLQATSGEDFITSKLHPKEVLLTGFVRMRRHLNVERLFYYVAVNFMK